MGGRHGGPADGVRGGVARVPGRGDAGSRREEVHAVSVVGPRGLLVALRGGRHRQGLGHPGRGVVAGVGLAAPPVAVARGHNVGEARVHGGTNRAVQRRARAATQRHVHHAGPGSVSRDPVQPCHDGAHRASPGAPEDPDRDEVDSLGHAVARSTHRAGHVGPVPVAVIAVPAIADQVDPRPGSTPWVRLKVRVGVANPRVHDVGGDPGSRGIVRVASIQRKSPLVDPVEPPGGVVLGGLLQVHDLVLLDPEHPPVPHEAVTGRLRDGAGEPVHHVSIDVARGNAVVRGHGLGVHVASQGDDELARHEAGASTGSLVQPLVQGREVIRRERAGWLDERGLTGREHGHHRKSTQSLHGTISLDSEVRHGRQFPGRPSGRHWTRPDSPMGPGPLSCQSSARPP